MHTHTHTHTHTYNSPTPCPWQEILPQNNQPSSDESWGRGELDDGGQPRVVLLPAVDQLGHHTVHHVFTLVRATATAGFDAAQTHTHNAGTHCTSHLYLGMGCSCCCAWSCANTHTMLAHTVHQVFTFVATAGLDAAQTHTHTHTMLAHTVHHAFTLVWATATAGLDAAQTHTLCCHTLYITPLPWYGPQPLLG